MYTGYLNFIKFYINHVLIWYIKITASVAGVSAVTVVVVAGSLFGPR